MLERVGEQIVGSLDGTQWGGLAQSSEHPWGSPQAISMIFGQASGWISTGSDGVCDSYQFCRASTVTARRRGGPRADAAGVSRGDYEEEGGWLPTVVRRAIPRQR